MGAPYYRGKDFERQVKNSLEQDGWHVIRSAGSKGLADLVALKKESPALLVQCSLKNVSRRKRAELRDLAYRLGCIARIARKVERGRIEFEIV